MAFLNWRMDHSDIKNILNLADGFLLSAILLAKKCLANNHDKKADIVIFPILANANHGIELYLKGMIWTLNKLLGNNSKIEGKHNIQQIFKTLRSKIKEHEGQGKLKAFDLETKELSDYLVELCNKVKATPRDDRMDFSRYPFSNKYENHFYVDGLGNVEIDLENFVYRFKRIKNKLEIISDFYYYQHLNRDW